eukprot:scaffold109685_cov48-Prasinocladus_malaysianus.AAC.1
MAQEASPSGLPLYSDCGQVQEKTKVKGKERKYMQAISEFDTPYSLSESAVVAITADYTPLDYMQGRKNENS